MSYPENIQFYYYELGAGNHVQKRDASFSYEDFVNLPISEIKKLSARGGGSRRSGVWRSLDGKLHGPGE